MRRSLLMLLPLTLLSMLAVAPAAFADCACLCMDGRLQTLCTSLEEAQANPEHCAGRAPDACPADLDSTPRQQYPAPADGAVNCRDVRIWDSAGEAYTSLRACDVQPAA